MDGMSQGNGVSLLQFWLLLVLHEVKCVLFPRQFPITPFHGGVLCSSELMF